MTRCTVTLLALLLAGPAIGQEDFGAWAVIRDPFPSTGGGGYMIGGYRPVLEGPVCTTPFTVTGPDGVTHHSIATFDAVPVQGGTLCTNGRWVPRDGGNGGTTPFRVFLRDGVARGHPLD